MIAALASAEGEVHSELHHNLSKWKRYGQDGNPSFQPMRASLDYMGRLSKVELLVGKGRPVETAPWTRTIVRTGLPEIRLASLWP